MQLQYPVPCWNAYIVNGCFECYDYLWCVEGRENGGLMRKEAQFENALGGVNRTDYPEPSVPVDSERLLLEGWYSPTYYSPNYFNYDNSALLGNYKRYFRLGTNWLNISDENSPDTTKQRYPQGWVLDDEEPVPSNSQNYGYVGFWTHYNSSYLSRKLEYIQQRLKQPLLFNSEDDPIYYKISFDMSKNFSLADHPEVVSGSQRIGAYFSKTAPTSYKRDEMVLSSKSDLNGTLVLVDEDSLVSGDEVYISRDGGLHGVKEWVHFEKTFHVNELANYITIGLFSVIENGVETNFKEHSSQFETAYYIDNVRIEKISYFNTLCECDKPGTDIPAAEIEIVPVSKDLNGCCFNYFFNYLANFNCIVTSISTLISINGVEKSSQTYNYQTSWADKQFYFGGNICFSTADLAPTQEHPIPEVTFSFTYILNGNTSCTLVKTLNLNCESTCICDNTAPAPIQIIKSDKKDCCYDVVLKLNEDNTIEKFCKYNEMEVIDITNSSEENLLFRETANKENGIFKELTPYPQQTGIWYYNPTKTITISNDELCFDPLDLANQSPKVIQIRLRNLETGVWCEFEQTIVPNCPINCSDLAGLPNTPLPPLEIKITPTTKNPTTGECCYEFSIKNNTTYNIRIPAINLLFSSSNSSFPEFATYDITTNLPLAWDTQTDLITKKIVITPLSTRPDYLTPTENVNLITLCIPESSSTIEVETSIRDSYNPTNNECFISKETLSCPSTGCDCNYLLLDFELEAIVNDDATEECCYKVTINPPNFHTNCTFNSAKVSVKQPGENDFVLELDNELTGNLISDFTFTNTICITPVGDNTAFSVRIEFKNTTNDKICIVEKDFEFSDCPCTCDESEVNFEFEANPPGSCCYDIYLSSECTRLFSEFNIQFPISLNDYLDEIDFHTKTNDITYTLEPGNIFKYKPKLPVNVFRGTRTYIGSFCIPPEIPSSPTPTVTLTAKDINNDECKTQTISMICDCCDGASVYVYPLSLCTWEIIVNNTSLCWISSPAADKYCYINVRHQGPSYGQSTPSLPWTQRVSLSNGESRTYEIVWTIKNLEVCKKIITLSCSYTGVPTNWNGGNQNGANYKIAIPFKNVGNGLVENLGFTPNPASSNATISYDLIKEVKSVTLAIYNLKGDIVSTIPVNSFAKGQNIINLNTTGISSGGYYLVINADNAKLCLPITILR
jgi:hypothetical protein